MPFSRGNRKAKTYDEAALYEYAVGALARRMRTVAELKRLMRAKVAHQDDADALVEAVTARLKEQKYRNDSAYAASYTSLRKENDRFGARRVATDLKAKGVHGTIVEQAVGAAYEDVNEEALARDFLARKRVRKPEDERGAARIFRMLVRAGFRSGTAVAILKKWDVDEEMLAQMEVEPDTGRANEDE